MPGPARTVAIVVTWNGWALTERCLDDLASSAELLDVLVVDNGSTDDTVAHVRRRDVEVLALPENRGFAAALNAGVRHVEGRTHAFVWLLNNDVRVPRECHAGLLRAAVSTPEMTVWTPALVSPDGEAQHVGGAWTLDGSRMSLLTTREMASALREGLWLSGTALFVSRDTLARVGAFDETLFAYWEDVDWCLRAARAGVELRVAPDAAVTHVGTAASGGRGSPTSTFLLARNEIHVLRKHVPFPVRHDAVRRVVARQLRWALVLERRGGRALAEAALAGLVAGLTGQHGPPRVLRLPPAMTDRLLTNAVAIGRRLEREAGPAG